VVPEGDGDEASSPGRRRSRKSWAPRSCTTLMSRSRSARRGPWEPLKI
jgi:hypothetical protein